jgi:hypothetical protein
VLADTLVHVHEDEEDGEQGGSLNKYWIEGVVGALPVYGIVKRLVLDLIKGVPGHSLRGQIHECREAFTHALSLYTGVSVRSENKVRPMVAPTPATTTSKVPLWSIMKRHDAAFCVMVCVMCA